MRRKFSCASSRSSGSAQPRSSRTSGRSCTPRIPAGSSQPSKSEPSATCSGPSRVRNVVDLARDLGGARHPRTRRGSRYPRRRRSRARRRARASVRLRGEGTIAWAQAWVTTSGRGGDLGHVPEPALVQVREVDEDAELLAGAHERRPASVRPGPVSGDAGNRNGTPWPNASGGSSEPERAQPERVQRGQQLELRVDRLGALDVHDGEGASAVELEVLWLARDPQRARRARGRAACASRGTCGDRERMVDRRLRLEAGRAASGGVAVGMRREDREEAAREPARASAREVEVAPPRSASANERSSSSTSLWPSKTGRAIAIR